MSSGHSPDPFSFEEIAKGSVPSSLPFLQKGPAQKDTLVYEIYSPESSRTTSSGLAQDELDSDGQLNRQLHHHTTHPSRTLLARVKAAALRLVADTPTLQDYIWHKDSFGLELAHRKGKWVLSGSADVSDAVADEMVIVWLLVQLSKKFTDIWIRVHDSDGEFLAIEAAEHVPDWLDPETDAYRVWINNGRVTLIPPGEAAKREQIDIEAALDKLSSSASSLFESAAVTEAAFIRLPRTDADISQNLHRSILTLPRKLAWIIHNKPQTVSKAVGAFYLRDPALLAKIRSGRQKTARTPAQNEDGPGGQERGQQTRFPVEDLVPASVLFNRVGYAQVYGQELSVPAAWADAVNQVRAEQDGAAKAKAMKRLELGMKLTVGYELLLADESSRDDTDVREIELLLDDIEEQNGLLPTDADMAGWKAHGTEDDDAWMNIDWRSFEATLSGKDGRGQGSRGGGDDKGQETPAEPATGASGPTEEDAAFGDKRAQENLRRIVERTKAFLDDETAGLDGFHLPEEEAKPQKSRASNTKGAAERPKAVDVKEWLGQSTDDDDDDDSGASSGGDDDEDSQSVGSVGSSVDSAAFDDQLRDMLDVPPHYAAAAGTGRPVFGPAPPTNYRNVDGRTVIMTDRLVRLEHERAAAATDDADSEYRSSSSGSEAGAEAAYPDETRTDSRYHRLVEHERARLRANRTGRTAAARARVRALPGKGGSDDDVEAAAIRQQLDRDRADRDEERRLIRDRLRAARAARAAQPQQEGASADVTGLSDKIPALSDTATAAQLGRRIFEQASAQTDGSGPDVFALASQFEAELRAAGALGLSAGDAVRAIAGSPSPAAAGSGDGDAGEPDMPELVDEDEARARVRVRAREKQEEPEEGEDGYGVDDDPDLALASNLLASLQSEPGGAGPTKHLLHMLGLDAPVPAPESDRVREDRG